MQTGYMDSRYGRSGASGEWRSEYHQISAELLTRSLAGTGTLLKLKQLVMVTSPLNPKP